MNKTILFSPVGGTDPISNTNAHDGALLHICRVYKPDEVIMYMSKEMLENHNKDNRYLYCLNKLSEDTGWSFEAKIIQRPYLTKVHEFDVFYMEFDKIIADLFITMDESDTLLLNLSSGTPAMKSALLVLKTMGEYPCKTIQVSTPLEKINQHDHEGYDVELLWEVNEDNKADYKNRCREVSSPSLAVMKNEEIIKKHIKVYDYAAAYDIARSLPIDYSKEYRDLLKLAACRMALDFESVDEIEKRKKYNCVPIKDAKSRKYYEYALVLNAKLERKEYVDFIRGITPIILDLFLEAFKKQKGVDLRKYLTKDSKWNPNKLRATEEGKKLLDVLNKSFGNQFKDSGHVYSIHIVNLFEKYGSVDSNLLSVVQKLRKVEEKVRNKAAHEIISLNESTILSQTGFTGKAIMGMIKEMFKYAGIVESDKLWESYDQMNQKILEKMDAHN